MSDQHIDVSRPCVSNEVTNVPTVDVESKCRQTRLTSIVSQNQCKGLWVHILQETFWDTFPLVATDTHFKGLPVSGINSSLGLNARSLFFTTDLWTHHRGDTKGLTGEGRAIHTGGAFTLGAYGNTHIFRRCEPQKVYPTRRTSLGHFLWNHAEGHT